MNIGLALEAAGYAARIAQFDAELQSSVWASKKVKGALDYLTKNKTTKGKMRTPQTPRKKNGGVSKKRIKATPSGKAVRKALNALKGTGKVPSKSSGLMSAMNAVNQNAISTRHKRTKKSFKGKAKKKVRVSKPLRQKIQKVLDGDKIYGTGRCLITGGRVSVNPPSAIEQNVFALPIPDADDVQIGMLFDPQFIMYVASRLWNGRPVTGTDLLTGSWSNVNTSYSNGGEWSNFTKQLGSNRSAFCVDVHNLKAKITIKNNTNRTQYLKMYECKPKYPCRFDPPGGLGKSKPHVDWDQGLDSDYHAKIKGFEPQSLDLASGINFGTGTLGSVGASTMYAKPGICQAWNKQWSYNAYDIILEAGQLHQHWVQGDVGEYDFSKYYATDETGGFVFNNIQKTNRHIFFTSVPEMATITNSAIGQSGRLLSSNGGDKFLFETEIFCSMSMPESAGTNYRVSNGTTTLQQVMQPLTQRKRAYFVDTFWDPEAPQNAVFTNHVDDNTGNRFAS